MKQWTFPFFSQVKSGFFFLQHLYKNAMFLHKFLSLFIDLYLAVNDFNELSLDYNNEGIDQAPKGTLFYIYEF